MLSTFFNCFDSYLSSILIFQVLQTKCKVNPQSIALDWIQSKLPDLHCIFRREFNQPAHCIYQSHHCIVFTGGGISTNTGLNDFTSSMTTVLTSGPGTWTRKENGVQLPLQQSSKWEQRKGLERPMEYNCHYLTGRSGTRPLLLFNYNCLLSIFLLWTFFNCFDSYLYSILIFQVLQTKCKVNPQSIALDWIQSKLPDLHCIFRREFNQPAHCI